MTAKRRQIQHWAKCKYAAPHTSKLEEFRSRAGIIDDSCAMRVFRLELMTNE